MRKAPFRRPQQDSGAMRVGALEQMKARLSGFGDSKPCDFAQKAPPLSLPCRNSAA